MWITLGIIAVCLVLVLAASNLNPRPAKEAVTKAWNVFNLCGFTVGTKSGNTINVAVQLKDAKNQNAIQITNAFVYLSANADGSTVSPTAPTSATVVGTNGAICGVHSNSVAFDVISNSAGKFDLTFTQTAGGTNYYFVVCLPDGSISVSPVLAF